MRFVFAAMLLLACKAPEPLPDGCLGPNACCYYWCGKPVCECKDGNAPNECEGPAACCYYWCPVARCKCKQGVPIGASAPDMAVGDEEFEEVQ